MEIVISGYGRMGKEIEKAALLRGHTISARIDRGSDWENHAENLKKAHVVIDFSQPTTAAENARIALMAGIPVVSGTTGWKPDYALIESLCREKGGAFMLGSNFSIGVNILFNIQKQLAHLTAQVGGYRPMIEEIHHIHKKDAPSGTAIHLANDLVKAYQSLTTWENTPTQDPHKLPVISYREGEIPGTHITTFTSAEDIITLKHEALGRTGFATGAILAAEWINGKTGIYSFEEVLGF